MSELNFASIEFFGIESLEPAFNPEVKEYTIHRRAGTEMSFRAVLNQSDFQRCSCEFEITGKEYKDYWSPGHVSLNGDEQALTASLHFVVTTEPMSAEQIKSCTHPHTRVIEGEIWGGASGSCCVELITICNDCGEETDKCFDHRN